MKLQKKINIVIILLAIILVSIISFVGVYKKYQNKMINVIPNYNVGTNLDGYRKVVIEVDISDSKKAKTEEGNNASDAKKAEKTQDEKNREYEKSLEIIKKRLSYLKVKDYTVSLDKNTGRIEMMLPEENDTDTVLSGLAETGKFEVVDSTNLEVLLTNSDISKAEIVKDNKNIPLTAKEYELLQTLYRNAGRIVTIDTLCEAVWGENAYVYTNSLMTHIRRIREKIEINPSHPVSLITMKGLGYKLIVEGK